MTTYKAVGIVRPRWAVSAVLAAALGLGLGSEAAAQLDGNHNHRGLTQWQTSYRDSVVIRMLEPLSVQELCARLGLRYPPPDPELVVRKSRRICYLMSAGRVVKVYPIALGSSPDGDKVRKGDGRTPEGQFVVCDRLPRSKYYRAFQLSYPSRDHARRGLAAGRISRSEYGAILRAHAEGSPPPAMTALGGFIEIHGNGIGVDWTKGCVAMRDRDIDELWPVVTVGAPVTIDP